MKNKFDIKELQKRKDAGERLTDEEYQFFKKNGGKTPKGSKGNTRKPWGNDFSWWNKYGVLLADATNFKDNWIAGTPLLKDASNSLIVDGVMRIIVDNTYGSDKFATDPINMSFRELYLRLFQKWRGISNYQAPDLGIVIIAGIEIVQLVAKLERIYGVVCKYDKENVNIPTALLSALELTQAQADWIRQHLSDYRYTLNTLIQKAQRLLIPADLTVVQNKISLFSYIYKDHDSQRGQMIVFDYDIYGQYSDTTFTTGSSVDYEYLSMSSNAIIDFTWNGTTQLFPKLNAMLDALLGSDSVQKIYGDLQAYFGLDQFMTFFALPQDYVVSPVYSESILHKIHNMETYGKEYGMRESNAYLASAIADGLAAADNTILTNAVTSGSISRQRYIYQFNNTLVTAVSLPQYDDFSENDISSSIDGYKYGFDKFGKPRCATKFKVLDSYHADFTPETITEGVLFKACYGDCGTGSFVAACAFEMIRMFETYRVNANGTVTFSQLFTHSNTTYARVLASYGSVYDWSPLFYATDIASPGSTPYTPTFQYLAGGDIDNARVVTEIDLLPIHRAVLLSGIRTDISVKPSGSMNNSAK